MKRSHFTHPYLLNPTHKITVNLVGVGGTGSQVLSALARIDHALYQLGHPGIHLRAFDPDIVTEANIGRQLFSFSDIGINKAVVLITRINRFYGVDWEAIPERFDSDSPVNITISCVDSAASRIEVKKYLHDTNGRYEYERQMYWMDFGNTVNSGQVILGTLSSIPQPKSEKHEAIAALPLITDMYDLTQIKEQDSGPSCSLAEALHKQDLFINSSLAQLGCALLWKLLSTGSIDYRGLFLNLENMNVNPIKL